VGELDAILPAVAARLGPPDDDPAPLPGGTTNRNWVVRIGGAGYVVRCPGRDTDQLGIDRRAEHAAAEVAAGLGIGPPVAAYLSEHECLVSVLLDAEPLGAGRLREGGVLEAVAGALRTLHEGPPLPATFDVFRVVEDHRDVAERRGARIPDAYGRLAPRAREIEAVLRGPDHAPVPCHDDLLPGNLLWDGTRVRIVDWEYAGMGDRFFDLANLSVNNELDPSADERLLRAYFGGDADDGRRAALQLMKVMSDLREAMWNVVQTALSDLDEDFAGAAGRLFARAEAAVADPAHAEHLEEARAAVP
jgi:aminoglycoside phosphotransferase